MLTPREHNIVDLADRSLPNIEIAAMLVVEKSTI